MKTGVDSQTDRQTGRKAMRARDDTGGRIRRGYKQGRTTNAAIPPD